MMGHTGQPPEITYQNIHGAHPDMWLIDIAVPLQDAWANVDKAFTAGSTITFPQFEETAQAYQTTAPPPVPAATQVIEMPVVTVTAPAPEPAVQPPPTVDSPTSPMMRWGLPVGLAVVGGFFLFKKMR